MNSPRDGDENFDITHHLLGTVVTNLWGACLQTPDTPDTALFRIHQARYDLGYRWVRHASAGQQWQALVREPDSVEDMAPRLKRTLWGPQACPDDTTTNILAWWVHNYAQGVCPVTGDPLYLSQIWHLDIFGPGGAGWPKDASEKNEPNDWTGNFFSFEGIFADPVDSGICHGFGWSDSTLTAWRNYASRAAELYGTGADTLAAPPDSIGACFHRWMIFNEPFMRGLFPWNTVTLFRTAKKAIRNADAAGTIYIGGTSGAFVDTLQSNHVPVPLDIAERQFALFAYGAGDTTGQLQNETLGFHYFAGGAPESPFISGNNAEEYYERNSGLVQRAGSIFSIGRFWGMDPVRVTIDEAAVMPFEGIEYSNPAEVQANYVERTLLLGLTTGYLHAIHLAFADGCDDEGHAPPRPGIASHRSVLDQDGERELRKPGHYAAALFDQVMGDAAYESSIGVRHVSKTEPDPDLYCLRFRSVTQPTRTVAALWSSNPNYDETTTREDSVRVQVANDLPFDLYYRIPSDPAAGWIYRCNDEVLLPKDPGGIYHQVINPQVLDPGDGPATYYVDVALSGAPLYLVSDHNHVRQELNNVLQVEPLSGIPKVGAPRVHQIYEITIQVEEMRLPDDQLAVVLPETWIAPQLGDPDQPGYVQVGLASHSLQSKLSDFEIAVDGNEIQITPADTLWPGCQLNLLYGDYRAQARLLDMGPWSSGPVDVDFLKMGNWMTADAEFDYRSGDDSGPPSYTVLPRAGWVIAPQDDSVLGEDQKRVLKFWNHPINSVYRDYNGLVFRNRTDNQPIDTQELLLRGLEPGVLYDVIIYLNNEESAFEEVEDTEENPYPGKHFKRTFNDSTYVMHLPDMTKQTVSVSSQDRGMVARDSSRDRVFRIRPGADGELRIHFIHGGDNLQKIPDETTLLDNMIYCYGVDVHPAALGGGPTEATPPGEQQIEYRINGVTVSTATLTLDPNYAVPEE